MISIRLMNDCNMGSSAFSINRGTIWMSIVGWNKHQKISSRSVIKASNSLPKRGRDRLKNRCIIKWSWFAIKRWRNHFMEDCIHYLDELKIDPGIGKVNAVVNKSIAIELVIQIFNLIEMRIG